MSRSARGLPQLVFLALPFLGGGETASAATKIEQPAAKAESRRALPVDPSVKAARPASSLSLGLSSTGYVGQGGNGRQGNYTSLDVGANLRSESSLLETRVWAQGMIGFNASDYRFVEAPELWVATSHAVSGPFQFTAGRRLEDWSHIDAEWGMGIWQPRFRWDYLRPQVIGLTGFFASYEQSSVRAVVMASPLFVPDRGAPLDFADGRISSISPWSLSPPYQIEYQEKTVPVRYKAEIPSVSDVVKQTSVSGMVRVGKKQGMWGSAGYAYKPMNQLLMSYEAYHYNNKLEVDATIYPRVAYHHLVSLETGYADPRGNATLSFLADVPKDAPQPGRLTSQVASNAYTVSPSVNLQAWGKGASGGRLNLSYLRKFGEELPDSGALADGSTNFDSRYTYRHAVLAGMKSSLGEKFGLDTRLLYDIAHPGTIVSWLVDYRPAKAWTVYVGADVLTSWTTDAEADGNDFVYRYRANDRLTGGLSYVF